MKNCISFIISLFIFVIFTTSAYATLPNQAVFNWIEYKFANMFPKAQTVKSELTHDGVHYDLRSWSGAWGTRYLGITDDGEVLGLGDYTDGVLLSFGYVDEWEDAVIADEDAVFNSIASVSSVVSNVPTLSDPGSLMWIHPNTTLITKGMDGLTHVFEFPSDLRQTGTFDDFSLYNALEFVQTSPGSDQFELLRELPEAAMGFCRDWQLMDTHRTDLKRFVIADIGLELNNDPPDMNAYYNVFPFGYVWVATDYGNGFEFEKINQDDYRSFYHTIDVHDIDGNGYDDIAVINMGSKSLDNEILHELPSRPDLGYHFAESVHTFLQDTNEEFTLESLFNAGEWEMNGGGSVKFIDLDNDGIDELIQTNYVYDENDMWANWGLFRVWQMDTNGKYSIAYTRSTPMQQLTDLIETAGLGVYKTKHIDYNNDGYEDILLLLESDAMDTPETMELYKNNGDMTFTRVSDEVIPGHIINKHDLWWRGATVVDVNNDGWDDIIVNGWGGVNFTGLGVSGHDEPEVFADYGTNGWPVNLGSCIFLNKQGRTFEQLTNISSLTFTVDSFDAQPNLIKYMSTENGVTKFFAFSKSYNETRYPIVITVRFDN